MANAAPVRALAMRVTRTDECGVPVAASVANSRVTTAGFITVGFGFDIYRSNDIQVPAASGAICIRSKGVPSILGGDLTVNLCDFNLAAMDMMLGSATLTDYAAPVEDVGGVITAGGGFNSNTVMLEWWSANNKNDACATGGANPQRPFIHFIAPLTNRWTIDGNMDFGNQETTVNLSGYADPTRAFAPSLPTANAGDNPDEWTAADIAAINASGLIAWREVTAIPNTVDTGYDAVVP